jgi:pimeloyl-ACP methyl ester carboxylesterase
MAFRVASVRGLSRGDLVATCDSKIERANLVAASRELATVDLMSSFKRITAQTVVFAPSGDRFVRRQAPLVAASIRNAQLVPLSGAGHLWPLKQPTPLTEYLRALASPERSEE